MSTLVRRDFYKLSKERWRSHSDTMCIYIHASNGSLISVVNGLSTS